MTLDVFKSVPLYIRLYKNRVKITHLETNRTIERISIKSFSNSRLVLGVYLVAEEFVKNIISELVPKKVFAPSLKIVMHQMELTEGCLSSVEKRALADSAIHMNAKWVEIVEHKKELTQMEALEIINGKVKS